MRPRPEPYRIGSRALAALALVTLPGAASAATVVVTPLVVDATVQPKQRDAVHKLIASELDFQPGVESVVDLPAAPPTLDQACLGNPRCLYGLATANGGTALFSGRMVASADSYLLELVFVDGTQARKQQFQVPQDPTRLANAMTPIVQQMLTGSGPAPAPAPPTSFDADPEPSTADLIAAGARPATGSFPPPNNPAPAPLPPPVPVAPQPSDADLAGMISFSQSASDISAEEIDQMIRFGPPPGSAPPMVAAATPAPPPQAFAPAPQPAPAPARRDASLAEEEQELADMERERAALADMEAAPAELPIKARLGHTVQFTARGGFSKYYAFNFVTAGGEFGVAAVGGLHVVAGVELFMVKRVLPPDVQLETGIYSEWNSIFPMNAGLVYKFPLGMAQPYVGADGIMVQYYKDDVGSDWAGGGRFRTGVDLMFIDNFGLNVNVAAGAWFGQNWSLIQQDVGNAGFLPQVSAGTVVAF